jgi:penicillin-binding protein-related factor A (putative recombinase)
LIVYFNRYEEFYLIHFEWIKDWIKRNNKKAIEYDEIKQSCIKLDLVYPGILTLIDKLIL